VLGSRRALLGGVVLGDRVVSQRRAPTGRVRRTSVGVVQSLAPRMR